MQMRDRSSRREKLKQSVQNREEERIAEESGGGGSSFTELDWLPLVQNKDVVFRMLGLPADVREVGSDVKLVDLAMLRDDENKWIRVIYPHGDKDFILRKIYKTVCAYEWDDVAQVPNYLYSDLDIFKNVRYNNAPQKNRRMQKGWLPQTVVMANVIDRADMAWHKENKHSKVVAKKKTVKEDKVYFSDGLPITAYKAIRDDIQRYGDNIDWETYDLVIRKLADDPWYKVYHGEDDAHKLSPEAQDIIVSGDLTEEEMNYELYNFDELYPLTSYRKLMNRLKLQIKDVDRNFNTHFYQELEELVSKEIADAGEEDETPKTTISTSPPEKTERREVEKKEEPVQEETSSRRSRRSVSEEKTSSLSLADVTETFVGIRNLSPEEKELIEVISPTEIKFKTEDELLPCPACNFASPETFGSCPKCGEEFEVE